VSALVVLGFYFVGATLVWYNFAGMRIPGVLQRIAVCYLIVSLIFLHTNWKQQTAIGIGLLLLYWLLMTLVPVPGCEINPKLPLGFSSSAPSCSPSAGHGASFSR
jgi:predicted acyltransferase